MATLNRKSGVLAALFNFFVAPGLGFLYVGRLRLALLSALLFIIIFSALFWSRIIFSVTGFNTFLLSIVIMQLTFAIAAFIIARRTVSDKRKWFQRWYGYFGFILIWLGIVIILVTYRSILFGYETYRIPSEAMANTLVKGDLIVTNSWIYRNSSPSRGDIVVFDFPENTQSTHIKRVIGLPGDDLKITNGMVLINDVMLEENYLTDNSSNVKGKEIAVILPENNYFVMGDNRKGSYDSRNWGFLPSENIKGKAMIIYYPTDSSGNIDTE